MQSDSQALVNIQIHSSQHSSSVVCKIDTGAEGNVIPVKTYKKLCPNSPCNSHGAPLDLTASSTTLTAFGGNRVKHHGTCTLTLSHNGFTKLCQFYVVDSEGPTILGLPTCRKMKLVSLTCSLTTQPENPEPRKLTGDSDAKSAILHEYSDCFKGVGCFPGEFHITLDPNAVPV